MNAEDFGHFERFVVDTLVSSAEKNCEGYKRFDQIAAVQVNVVIRLRNHISKDPVGNLFRGSAAWIAGEDAIGILAIERTYIYGARCESRHVKHGHDYDAAAEILWFKGAPEFERRSDACVFGGMDTGGDNESRTLSRAVNQPHRKAIGLSLHRELIYAESFLSVRGGKRADFQNLFWHGVLLICLRQSKGSGQLSNRRAHSQKTRRRWRCPAANRDALARCSRSGGVVRLHRTIPTVSPWWDCSVRNRERRCSR